MHRSWRGSQSGFPLLTPKMETYDGPSWRLISTSLCLAPSSGILGFFQTFGTILGKFWENPGFSAIFWGNPRILGANPGKSGICHSGRNVHLT